MRRQVPPTTEATRPRTPGNCTSSALVTTQPIPFQFGSHALRVSLGDDGEPWFNAIDVCMALGHSNTSKALKDHVDADDLTKRYTIDNLGRAQNTNHVNESGMFALIFSSNLPAAKQFKRWVTHEVLPSIRKTGSYSSGPVLPPQTKDIVDAIFLMGEYLAKVPGVKSDIAMAATFACIHENTGIAVEHLRKALPANTEAIASMNPTSLGKQLGLSARRVNELLASLGFQFRNSRDEWELTEVGRAFGEALPYAGKNHSGYQILWKHAVIERLREAC